MQKPGTTASGVAKIPAQTLQDYDGPCGYMSVLQKWIKRGWIPVKVYETNPVVAIFKVHRGGELSNLHIEQSSGIASVDNAALKAIQSAAPFLPLPKGCSDPIDIQFTFDERLVQRAQRSVSPTSTPPLVSPRSLQ
jgi:TonB family protein